MLEESPRINRKNILARQQGITSKQMDEMKNSNVVLAVSKNLHELYHPEKRDMILTVEEFIHSVKSTLNGSA